MKTIKIDGMRCAHCQASVTKALEDIEGVSNVQVNLENKEATFEESAPVDIAVLKEAIAKIGFEVIG